MPTRRAALAFGLAAPALAQTAWPDRPIRVVIPFPPGGSNDTVARIIQPRLQEILGRPIVVDNRAGGSGSLASSEVARAAPDGYTWVLANDTLAANDTLMQLPYRAGDLTVCSLLGTCPFALTAHPSQNITTLPQLIEAAKARPDRFSYATTGVGSLAHIATVLLQSRGGFTLTHVPYRGGGPALQDALAGHVPLFMSNIVITMPHMRAGALKPLGVSSATESRFLPSVPTFAAQGFPGFEALTYWIMVGPAGVSAAITQRFQQAIAQVLAEAPVQARMAEQGAEIVAGTSAEGQAFLRREIARWGQVIRDNDIRVDS